MQYGDTVSIWDRSIQIPAKELEAIGIYDSSCCWGAWVNDWRALANLENYSGSSPNLLITPFAPNSWPFLLRIELRLRFKYLISKPFG